ncbi:TIR domain-containing protein [Cytobacillus horneckiae]|uniref:DNA-binding protein n=1 Tax=Cytobacillus horneckiae TaxID=549687 RepID=A0A2N0ZJV2_9BACI|nr:nucleotide-binding protein [Cytobacillus horneckiae]MEC1158166.1 nucleotide-binding protein [Cytobacillus horneckiae]MED2940433.1 nucleotide-binding protein [Cytobacillus horneckiae]PKG29799.1 DNA-binding protein [Cytobacillus horneckiae]
MLYQVFMEVTNILGAKENFELFEFDKPDRNQIIEDVILPYLNKDELQFNGYFLEAQNVVRIVVKTTDESVKKLAEIENSNNPPGFFFFTTEEHIVGGDKHTKDITKEIISEAREKMSKAVKKKQSDVEFDKNKVFIVHGHDEVVKLSVARFLERLGLQPIILHEQASGGTTIIEKIENNSNVGFGIVLYTPCDLGKAKNDEEFNARARQNVIFEHGYLIGKLGRSNVCALVKDDVEKPNDISGVVYINYDSGNGWHLELFKELKNAGYDINANLLFG